MKKLIFTFLIAFLMGNTWSEVKADVLIVDNSVNSPGIYPSINDAVAAAQAGDTIYLQPSGVQYSGATINKSVHLIGPGHTINWTTSLPHVASISIVSPASGTIIEGITVVGSVSLGNNITDVVIRNCRLSATNSRITTGESCHNLVIEGNVIQNYTSLFSIIATTQSTQNILIKNNFILMNTTGTSATVLSGVNATTQFDHNTVILTNTGGSYCTSCQPHTVSNNIWIGASQNLSSGSASSIFYNNQTWSASTTFDPLPGVNNIDNVEPVFVNAPAYAWTINNDYNLEESNAGFTGSSTGGQIGMYGGVFDFRKRGEPRGVPTFDQILLLTTSVPQDGTIQISVKAKKGME